MWTIKRIYSLMWTIKHILIRGVTTTLNLNVSSGSNFFFLIWVPRFLKEESKWPHSSAVQKRSCANFKLYQTTGTFNEKFYTWFTCVHSEVMAICCINGGVTLANANVSCYFSCNFVSTQIERKLRSIPYPATDISRRVFVAHRNRCEK